MSEATKRYKQFRIYKPNKTNNGAASKWELSFKPDNQYDKYLFFLELAKQKGEADEKGNSQFDWDNAISVKLGENDLGEIISVLERRKDSVGTKGSLFHQTPGGGNKVVNLEATENGFSLAASAQDADKNSSGKIYHSITHGEAAYLLVILKKAVETIMGW